MIGSIKIEVQQVFSEGAGGRVFNIKILKRKQDGENEKKNEYKIVYTNKSPYNQ